MIFRWADENILQKKDFFLTDKNNTVIYGKDKTSFLDSGCFRYIRMNIYNLLQYCTIIIAIALYTKIHSDLSLALAERLHDWRERKRTFAVRVYFLRGEYKYVFFGFSYKFLLQVNSTSYSYIINWCPFFEMVKNGPFLAFKFTIY